MKMITYEVPNISCGHCVMRIKNALSAVEGVLSVEGNPTTHQVVVEFEDPATDEILREALARIDYPAVEA